MRIWRRFWKELVIYTQLRSGSSGAGNIRDWLARPPASKCLILIINFAPKQILIPLFPRELETWVSVYINKMLPLPLPRALERLPGYDPLPLLRIINCLRNWNSSSRKDQSNTFTLYPQVVIVIPTQCTLSPRGSKSVFSLFHQINKSLVHEVQCINLQSSNLVEVQYKFVINLSCSGLLFKCNKHLCWTRWQEPSSTCQLISDPNIMSDPYIISNP